MLLLTLLGYPHPSRPWITCPESQPPRTTTCPPPDYRILSRTPPSSTPLCSPASLLARCLPRPSAISRSRSTAVQSSAVQYMVIHGKGIKVKWNTESQTEGHSNLCFEFRRAKSTRLQEQSFQGHASLSRSLSDRYIAKLVSERQGPSILHKLLD